jgi:hypothetical protein
MKFYSIHLYLTEVNTNRIVEEKPLVTLLSKSMGFKKKYLRKISVKITKQQTGTVSTSEISSYTKSLISFHYIKKKG